MASKKRTWKLFGCLIKVLFLFSFRALSRRSRYPNVRLFDGKAVDRLRGFRIHFEIPTHCSVLRAMNFKEAQKVSSQFRAKYVAKRKCQKSGSLNSKFSGHRADPRIKLLRVGRAWSEPWIQNWKEQPVGSQWRDLLGSAVKNVDRNVLTWII